MPSEAVLRPPQPTSPSILSPFATTVATVVGCELDEDVHNESRIVSEVKDSPLSKSIGPLYNGTLLGAEAQILCMGVSRYNGGHLCNFYHANGHRNRASNRII